MGTTITILSQKGGTGKTTTVRSLADVFRRAGLEVLCVDLDPQGNLSDYFDVPADASPTVADVLSGQAKAADAVHEDVLPANLGLAEAELILAGKMGRELTLRRALRELKRRYDLILIDCPPSLGLLTVNALVAADHALISTEAEYFSLQGVEQALEVIELAKESLHPDLDWLGTVLNIADMRLVHSREALRPAAGALRREGLPDGDPALGALRRVGRARGVDRGLRAGPRRRLRVARRRGAGTARWVRRRQAAPRSLARGARARVGFAVVSDLMFKPVAELAQLVRDGEITSRELVEASFERIEALQPELNAFVHLDQEGALAAADAVGPGDPRPFAGVPIAMKDTTPVAGMPFTFGSDLFGDFVAMHDSYVTRRIREAGFVIVGKTNMPEFGILPVSEPRRFGPARNPWDTSRTPGGSSGGAAAAVASGMVPIAHGSDGGGSIRIPAACCGLVGLKPTRGRVSRGPEQGDDFLVQDGVLSRTIAETAEMLDILAGYELGDATWAPPPAEPFARAAASEPGRLRIGVTTAMPIAGELDPMAAGAVTEAVELLSSLGHEVEDFEAPWAGEDLLETFTMVFGTGIATAIYFGGLITGREPSEDLVEPLSWETWKIIQGRGGMDYLLARTQLQAVSRAWMAPMDQYDVVLTPALGQRPVQIGELDACSDNPLDDFRRSGLFTPYTASST